MAVTVREKVQGSKVWWVFVNHKGRRLSKRVGDRATANSLAKEMRERIAKDDLGMLRDQCPTVAGYGKEWLESPLRGWEDSTQTLNASIFKKHIKPQLGGMRLNELKRRHVKAFISHLKGEELSPSRIQNILAVLSGLFESAIDDELVEVNPTAKSRKHYSGGRVKEIDPLTAQEVQLLLEKAATLPVELGAFYLVAARTGLRVGELLALRWTDIDLEGRTVEVSKSYNYQLHKEGPPKNKKTRTIDLTPKTAEALRDLRREQKVTSLGGPVFTDGQGNRLEYGYLLNTLKAIAPRDIGIHTLRHTYATLRIAKGDNILDVSKQLGHHKVAFTLDTYAHWMPGEHKAQVDELDTLHLAAPPAHPATVNPLQH